MEKVLFVTPILEHPPAGGPFLRIENTIKALSQICSLHIISRVSKDRIGGEKAEIFYKSLSQNFLYAPSVSKKKKIYTFRALWSKLLLKLKIFLFLNKEKRKSFFEVLEVEQDAHFINDYVVDNNISIIWFGYGCISGKLIERVRELNPTIKIVCDTDSVQSRYFLRGLPFAENLEHKKLLLQEAKEKIAYEAVFSNLSDIVIAVSGVDASYYKQLVNETGKVQYFPNVIDVNYYEKENCKLIESPFPIIILSGYFGLRSPMNHAAGWFIDKVFPLVLNHSKAILYLVGRGSDTLEINPLYKNSIKLIGKVDSVLPFLKSAKVSVVPLFFESGTRFKILEAAASEIPIVSTSLGAEGLNVINGRDILIADTPNDFAQAVITLLQNRNYAQQLVQNCRKLTEEEYTIPVLIKQGKNILQILS